MDNKLPPATARIKFGAAFFVASVGFAITALVAGMGTDAALATGAGLCSVSASILFVAAALDKESQP